MSQDERRSCAECDFCYSLGNGQGWCDFEEDILEKKIVDVFKVEPDCPRLKKGEAGK